MISDQSLFQIRQVIDGLKARAKDTSLTETEQGAVHDCLRQAYDRAAYLLHMPTGARTTHQNNETRCSGEERNGYRRD